MDLSQYTVERVQITEEIRSIHVLRCFKRRKDGGNVSHKEEDIEK